MLRILTDIFKTLLVNVPVGLLYFIVFVIVELVYRVLSFWGFAVADLDYWFVCLGSLILAGDILIKFLQIKIRRRIRSGKK